MTTALFSLTLWSSAFLLFCIEPLVAKMLLPIAGGVPAVWSTCLVFFQATLLVGYAFTQATLARLGPRAQAFVYVVLFPAALVTLPIAMPARALDAQLGSHPALSVLALLVTTVGAPFFVLSTLAPAVQRWFSVTGDAHAKDPYFLYAASNVGSLAALALYPLVIEPSFDLGTQSRALRAAFVVLALLSAACAWKMKGGLGALHAARGEPIAWMRRLRWVILAAVPSAELVAVTSYVTTAVAPAPLLWAVPLAAYLFSFVVVFAKKPIASHASVKRRLPFAIALGMLLIVTDANSPAWLVIALHVLVLFVVAVFCHGAIAEDRPEVARLPEFYTWMSLGGAVGGAAAALGAPLVLTQPIEYPVCLLLALACLPIASSAPTWTRVLAALAILLAIASDWIFGSWAVGLLATAAAGVPVLVAFALDRHPRVMMWGLAGILLVRTWSADARGHVLVRERSFFGAFSVVRAAGETMLMHGNTMHGLELDHAHATPTLYYAQSGPIGDVIALARSRDPRTAPLRVALVGLGAGTLATYARPGETWRFFELDPAVIRIAKDARYFTFLHDAFGDHADVVTGDARIELARGEGNCERAPDGALRSKSRCGPSDRNWDLLVVDAFTSDAIPTHLLTREAFAMYRQKLSPGALVAWHVSNRHLDLSPALAALADDAGWSLLIRHDNEQNAAGKSPSIWIATARAMAELDELRGRGWKDVARRAGFRCWTDERASIVTVWN